MGKEVSTEAVVRDFQRKAHKTYSAEEKIRIVLQRRWGESSIAEPCRRERTPTNLHFRWTKDSFDAAKTRLMADTLREANSREVDAVRWVQVGITRVRRPMAG